VVHSVADRQGLGDASGATPVGQVGRADNQDALSETAEFEFFAEIAEDERLMVTPGALNAFAATGENPMNYIARHMNLDPSSLGAEDQLENLRAVRDVICSPIR
jgi:hypothetical protein